MEEPFLLITNIWHLVIELSTANESTIFQDKRFNRLGHNGRNELKTQKLNRATIQKKISFKHDKRNENRLPPVDRITIPFTITRRLQSTAADEGRRLYAMKLEYNNQDKHAGQNNNSSSQYNKG